ncbi:MAG: hypothetical protein K5930_02265 [Treponemataceae bacterium]|nr:hypothetical protein [Treponemataceae bacterium]
MQFTKSIGKEILSHLSIDQVLRTRLTEINTLLELKLKALKKAPEGTLHTSESNGVVQYYHKTAPSSKHGSYISSKNAKLAQQLAQADYDRKLVTTLSREAQVLQRAFNEYSNFLQKHGTVENLFDKITKNKRKLVKPISFSDEEFAAIWSSIPYKGRAFTSDQAEHFTTQGERVRSKSEVIIADTLSRLKIPYRYEYPIEMVNDNGDVRTFYPDFLCLNLKTRQEFIWEHFGKMDDGEYAASAARKLRLFEQNNIFPGKNLIITVETSELPINTKQVERIIRHYL